MKLNASTTIKLFVESQPEKVNLVSFKRFVQFLVDTGRIDYEQADDILDFLKRRRKR